MAHPPPLLAHPLQRRNVDLDVEVAGVGHDGAVLHHLEVTLIKDMDVAGRGAEDVADGCGLHHWHDAEAVHHRLQRLQRIDLGHDDVGTQPLGAHRDAAAAPAVAADHEVLAGQQDVGGADDAVQRALAGAVAVVEQVLGHGVVDGDDRVLQRAVLGHGLEANDAGGGLLRAADHRVQQLGPLAVQRRQQVTAVVHGHVRLVIQRGVEMLVVGVVVLALDGVDGHLVVGHQRGGHVILRAQRVAGGQHHIRAAGLQDPHQIAGLRRHVQARADAQSLQRPVLAHPLFQQVEHRHLARCPLHSEPAFLGQLDVFDVVIHVLSPRVWFGSSVVLWCGSLLVR